MNVVLNEILSIYLRGRLLTKDEKESKDLLKWALIKNGLVGIDQDSYLGKNKKGQYFCKQSLEISEKEDSDLKKRKSYY